MTSYIEAKKDIDRGKLSRVYLIYGMETYMIDDLTQSIVKQVLREDDAEFNLSQYDLRDTAIQVGLEDIETPSFFRHGKSHRYETCLLVNRPET
ncbi:hypothetical protein [Geomicrobium sp. JCM 19055]|uniref:hypothetical protein n=1 Tax=Geomicrobium sp. JCM 19055 TaxID=1460649 RepID=UPI0005A9CA37|nr:hypothetical protein [Geomicrobium sp. JCM 19055]